jgi:hypothetical protein
MLANSTEEASPPLPCSFPPLNSMLEFTTPNPSEIIVSEVLRFICAIVKPRQAQLVNRAMVSIKMVVIHRFLLTPCFHRYVARSIGCGCGSWCPLVFRAILRTPSEQRPAVARSGSSSQLAIASPKVMNVDSRWRQATQNMATHLMALQMMTATNI